MFSLAYNLPTTMSTSSKFRWKKYVQTKSIIWPSKLCLKKYVETQWIFRWKKLHQKKHVEARWIFRPSNLHQKKYMETTWIFWPSKLHRKKYVETTLFFRPSKLHRKKYVETTWNFRPSKLRQKITWKWRGNSSKFGRILRIHVISTSKWRRFNVECPLGFCMPCMKCLSKSFCSKKPVLPSKIRGCGPVHFNLTFHPNFHSNIWVFANLRIYSKLSYDNISLVFWKPKTFCLVLFWRRYKIVCTHKHLH